MIEKNALPGAEEYFQAMVRALNVECDDLNNRQACTLGAISGSGEKFLIIMLFPDRKLLIHL